MGKRSRALLFLFVNIIVSAAATLTVLYLWERTHPEPEIIIFGAQDDNNSNSNSQDPLIEQSPDINPTLPSFNEDITINIRTIVGAGDVNVEYVEIVNQGQNPADLTGWQLIGDSERQFTFPALILNSGGAIKVLSKAGTNTVIELYWQSDSQIWRPGETVRLLNAEGKMVTSYTIP